MPHSLPRSRPDPDRVLVVSSPTHALDLLRLAILRSDDVRFVAEAVPSEAGRFALRFAVEVVRRPFKATDLAGASVVLLSLDDPEAENRIVRHARRHGVPVHVAGRPLVSDLSALAMLEQPSLPAAAA